MEKIGKIKDAINSFNSIPDLLTISDNLIKSRILVCDGKIKEANKIFQKDHKIPLQEKNKVFEFQYSVYLAYTSYFLKESIENVGQMINEAKFLYHQMNDLEKSAVKETLCFLQTTKGLHNEIIGNFSVALESFTKAAKNFELNGHTYYLSGMYGHIGRIQQKMGELDKALFYYSKELDLARKLQDLNRMARSTLNIASLNWRKSKLDEAYELYKESLKFSIESENDLYIAETLFDLILISLEFVTENNTNYYMSELEKYTESSANLEELIRCQIAKAMILMNSTRMINRAKAQEILKIVVNSDMVNQQLTIFAMQNLCVLLLEELQLYGDSEVLFEINTLLESLSNIAKKQGSYVLDIEVLLLQAKFALLEGKGEKTFKFIKEAKDIAMDKHLEYLINKINEIDKSMSDDIHKWMLVVESDSSMRDRVEKTKISEYLKDAIKLKNFLKDASGPFS